MRLRPSILIIIVSVFFSCKSFAQTKQIDSLKLVLANAKEDTNKVRILGQLYMKYRNINDYENAIKSANSALTLSKKIKFVSGEYDALRYLGASYVSQYHESEALKFFSAALELAKGTGNKIMITQSYGNVALTYSYQDNYPEALKNYFNALRIYEETGNKVAVANVWISIGNIYLRQDNQNEALNSGTKALKLLEESRKDTQAIVRCYWFIGGLKLLQGDYGKALELFSEALKFSRTLNNKLFIASTISRIGKAYEGLGKNALVEKDKVTAEQMFGESLKNYNNSLSLYKELGVDDGVIGLRYLEIGSVYILLKKFSVARDYLTKALQLTEANRNKKAFQDCYLSLSKLDSAQGNYTLAYEHYKTFIIYRDSIHNEESTRKAEGYKMQYEFDKKEDSLKQKQVITETRLSTQKKQRYFYWGGLAMLALLSLFVFLNFRNQKKINRLAGEAHAKQKAELELQSLRAQLNPHFMFNSLNAIQELILLEENEKSQSYLARFSKLLRMLLENAERPFIPLQREIDFLQLYLSLENLRIPDLDYTITFDPAIDTEQTAIPNMILQPYIENAIWHGLSHKPNDKKLQLRITKTNGIVQYEIQDNGVGRKKSEELKSLFRREHKSKGMELLSKRFKLLAKEYGSDIETSITDVMNNGEVAGTLVTIKVPGELSLTFKRQQP